MSKKSPHLQTESFLMFKDLYETKNSKLDLEKLEDRNKLALFIKDQRTKVYEILNSQEWQKYILWTQNDLKKVDWLLFFTDQREKLWIPKKIPYEVFNIYIQHIVTYRENVDFDKMLKLLKSKELYKYPWNVSDNMINLTERWWHSDFHAISEIVSNALDATDNSKQAWRFWKWSFQTARLLWQWNFIKINSKKDWDEPFEIILEKDEKNELLVWSKKSKKTETWTTFSILKHLNETHIQQIKKYLTNKYRYSNDVDIFINWEKITNLQDFESLWDKKINHTWKKIDINIDENWVIIQDYWIWMNSQDLATKFLYPNITTKPRILPKESEYKKEVKEKSLLSFKRWTLETISSFWEEKKQKTKVSFVLWRTVIESFETEVSWNICEVYLEFPSFTHLLESKQEIYLTKEVCETLESMLFEVNNLTDKEKKLEMLEILWKVLAYLNPRNTKDSNNIQNIFKKIFKSIKKDLQSGWLTILCNNKGLREAIWEKENIKYVWEEFENLDIRNIPGVKRLKNVKSETLPFYTIEFDQNSKISYLITKSWILVDSKFLNNNYYITILNTLINLNISYENDSQKVFYWEIIDWAASKSWKNNETKNIDETNFDLEKYKIDLVIEFKNFKDQIEKRFEKINSLDIDFSDIETSTYKQDIFKVFCLSNLELQDILDKDFISSYIDFCEEEGPKDLNYLLKFQTYLNQNPDKIKILNEVIKLLKDNSIKSYIYEIIDNFPNNKKFINDISILKKLENWDEISPTLLYGCSFWLIVKVLQKKLSIEIEDLRVEKTDFWIIFILNYKNLYIWEENWEIQKQDINPKDMEIKIDLKKVLDGYILEVSFESEFYWFHTWKTTLQPIDYWSIDIYKYKKWEHLLVKDYGDINETSDNWPFYLADWVYSLEKWKFIKKDLDWNIIWVILDWVSEVVIDGAIVLILENRNYIMYYDWDIIDLKWTIFYHNISNYNNSLYFLAVAKNSLYTFAKKEKWKEIKTYNIWKSLTIPPKVYYKKDWVYITVDNNVYYLKNWGNEFEKISCFYISWDKKNIIESSDIKNIFEDREGLIVVSNSWIANLIKNWENYNINYSNYRNIKEYPIVWNTIIFWDKQIITPENSKLSHLKKDKDFQIVINKTYSILYIYESWYLKTISLNTWTITDYKNYDNWFVIITEDENKNKNIYIIMENEIIYYYDMSEYKNNNQYIYPQWWWFWILFKDFEKTSRILWDNDSKSFFKYDEDFKEETWESAKSFIEFLLNWWEYLKPWKLLDWFDSFDEAFWLSEYMFAFNEVFRENEKVIEWFFNKIFKKYIQEKWINLLKAKFPKLFSKKSNKWTKSIWKSVTEKLKENRSKKLDLSLYLWKITSQIDGQDSWSQIYAREIPVNSIDAINWDSKKEKTIEINSFEVDWNMVNEFFDKVWMTPEQVDNYLIPIWKSSKDIPWIIWKFWQWFYSSMIWAKEVLVKTSVWDWKTVYIKFKPIIENWLIKDIAIFKKIVKEDFIWTKLQRVDIEKWTKSHINGMIFLNNLIKYIWCVDDFSILYNWKNINDKNEVLFQEYIDGLWTLKILKNQKIERVISRWTYMSEIKEEYIDMFPDYIKEIIKKEKLTIEIPENISLLSSRNSVANSDDIKRIKPYIYKLILKYIVFLSLEWKINIPMLPEDYFWNDSIEKKLNDNQKSILKLAKTINNWWIINDFELLKNKSNIALFLAYLEIEKSWEKVSLHILKKRRKDKEFLEKHTDWIMSENIDKWDVLWREKSHEKKLQINELDEEQDIFLDLVKSKFNKLFSYYNLDIELWLFKSNNHSTLAYAKWKNNINFNANRIDYLTNDIKNLINAVTHELAHIILWTDSAFTHQKDPDHEDSFEKKQREILEVYLRIYN